MLWDIFHVVVSSPNLRQARGVLTIDTTDSEEGNVGIVAVIPIGMAQVSSVKLTASPGTKLQKGADFGYFQFGGSDIIVLFQKEVDAQILKTSTYTHYGRPIAFLNSV